MNHASFLIRRATKADLPALGALGAQLIEVHYGFDARRFMAPGGDMAGGYAWFLGEELAEPDSAVFVADVDGAIGGYVYASIEPQSWKELREEAGFIHDVVVHEGARRMGLAAGLIDAAIGWLRERGMPRVVLWAAEQNSDAQRLFTRLGFRRTMVEMTREL